MGNEISLATQSMAISTEEMVFSLFPPTSSPNPFRDSVEWAGQSVYR